LALENDYFEIRNEQLTRLKKEIDEIGDKSPEVIGEEKHENIKNILVSMRMFIVGLGKVRNSGGEEAEDALDEAEKIWKEIELLKKKIRRIK